MTGRGFDSWEALGRLLQKWVFRSLEAFLRKYLRADLGPDSRSPVLGTIGIGLGMEAGTDAVDQVSVNIEHGLFIAHTGGFGEIEISDSVKLYYVGPGDTMCDNLDDHLYGNSIVGPPCTSDPTMLSLAWNEPVPTGDTNTPHASATDLTNWVSNPNRSPSSHSGRSRWVAQARQALADMKSLRPTGWPTWDPKFYGVAKVHTLGVSLSYWTIYAGNSGVFACRLKTPPEVDHLMEAVKDEAVEGYSIREEEIRRFESVIYRAASASPQQKTLLTTAPHLDGGAAPLAFGIKWSDSGLAGKIVTLKGSGDDGTAEQWHLELQVGDVGGVDEIVGATWTNTEQGGYNPRPSHSKLMVTILGQTVPRMSDVGADIGNSVVVYQVSYNLDPLRYQFMRLSPGTTPSTSMYAPGVWGAGSDTKRYTLTTSSRNRGGYYISPLQWSDFYTAKKTLEYNLTTYAIGSTTVEKSGRVDLSSYNYEGFPDVSDVNGGIYDWEMGRIVCTEDEISSGAGSTLTAVVVPETDCEAVYIAEYHERQGASHRHWEDSTSPIAISMRRAQREDVCTNAVPDPSDPCPPYPGNGFVGFCWQQRTGWGWPDPSWSDGRARLSKDLYGPPIPLPSCAYCTPTYGFNSAGADTGGSIISGIPQRPGTTTNTNVSDFRDARSWLVTPRNPVALSSDLGAWTNAIQGVPSAGPVVFMSAGGNSMVYQEEENSIAITTGGEDISDAQVLRYVGSV